MIEVEARDLIPYGTTFDFITDNGIANYQSVLLNQVSSTLWRADTSHAAMRRAWITI